MAVTCQQSENGDLSLVLIHGRERAACVKVGDPAAWVRQV